MKTTSLELSKQLKKVEFPQDTYFEWEIGLDNEAYLSKRVPEHGADEPRYFPAPTAEEILDVLPIFAIKNKKKYRFRFERAKNGDWDVKYRRPQDHTRQVDVLYKTQHESLAEAAGKMYLYLKKEKLI